MMTIYGFVRGFPGILPQFGPAFINFYGCAREFGTNDMHSDKMNSGQVGGQVLY